MQPLSVRWCECACVRAEAKSVAVYFAQIFHSIVKKVYLPTSYKENFFPLQDSYLYLQRKAKQ